MEFRAPPVALRMSAGKKLVLGILAALGAVGCAAVYLYSHGRSDRSPAPMLAIDLGGGVKMEMVYIKPGRFMMGSNEGCTDEALLGPEDAPIGHGREKPVHEVMITKGFYLGKFEVTQEQYERVTGTDPSMFKGANSPVECVSWNDAVEFCRKLSQRTGRKARLPTEAEWEYACRAGSTMPFYFGDDESKLGGYAWYHYIKGGKPTHPVGQKRPNAWGLYDMHGHVWEWCSDWYGGGYYAKSPRQDPGGPAAGKARVMRGGAWNCGARDCRSASRFRLAPTLRAMKYSFRAAASVAPGKGNRR